MNQSKERVRRVPFRQLIMFLPLAMFAPGVPDLMLEFRSTSEELAAFCVSVYVLGFAAGPMFFAPLSEIYGRSIIYNITNVGFIGRNPPRSFDSSTL